MKMENLLKSVADRPVANQKPAVFRQQIATCEREKTLLALSSGITQVREKNDLIMLFPSRLKGGLRWSS